MTAGFVYAKIASDCAVPCTLLGYMAGTREREAELHQQFAEWHSHREWFRLDGAVREFVDGLPPIPPDADCDEPLKFIRKVVFAMTQLDFARANGIANDKISKMESGDRRLTFDDMLKIRTAAIDRSLDWNDSWFFEVPPAPALRLAA